MRVISLTFKIARQGVDANTNERKISGNTFDKGCHI